MVLTQVLVAITAYDEVSKLDTCNAMLVVGRKLNVGKRDEEKTDAQLLTNYTAVRDLLPELLQLAVYPLLAWRQSKTGRFRQKEGYIGS